MFDKEKERSGGTGTVVGSNVTLTGIIKDSNDIVVHGRVEGEVVSEQTVTITEGAEIKGPISAREVTIAGKVSGSIAASEKIEILSSGKVFGSISMKELIIRSGAVFVGKSTMPEHAKEAATEAKVITNDESHVKTTKFAVEK